MKKEGGGSEPGNLSFACDQLDEIFHLHRMNETSSGVPDYPPIAAASYLVVVVVVVALYKPRCIARRAKGKARSAAAMRGTVAVAWLACSPPM